MKTIDELAEEIMSLCLRYIEDLNGEGDLGYLGSYQCKEELKELLKDVSE